MDYTPTTIGDIVFACDVSKDIIEGIVDGSLPFPIAGKNGIIIYGTYGTGKTALAKLLPNAIENQINGHNAFVITESIYQGNNGTNLIDKIYGCTSRVPYSSQHYVILDEVDNLTKDSMSSLKTLMNRPQTVFIMTTNSIPKIDKGVLNRSHCIEFNVAPAHKWLPLMQRILQDENVAVPSDAVLLPVIEKCDGSAREIVTAGFRLARQQKANGLTLPRSPAVVPMLAPASATTI